MYNSLVLRTALWTLLLSVAVACESSEKQGSDASVDVAVDHPLVNLKWYATCGDPVCGIGHRAMPGVPACTTQKAGDSCTAKAESCDPQSDCNELLRCTDADPRVQPGGCPISSQKYKYEIKYVDSVTRKRMSDEVNDFKLAQYKYKADPSGRLRLGFIIEDAPHSPAVDVGRDQIDLYAYTSMVVAALQTEHEALAAQRQETAALRKEIEALKKAVHGTKP